MFTRRPLLAAFAGGMALACVIVPSSVSEAVPQPTIDLCHATNSVENPYNLQSVTASSIVMPDGQPTGHGAHPGPIYPAEDWGDIIPPFHYNNDTGGTSLYPGMNWSVDGQAIFAAGCQVDLAEPEPPTTTTTLPPTTTTTAGGQQTTTTMPQATTTTQPPTTPTTAPSSELPPEPTDPPGGAETMPPVNAEVVDPGGHVVSLGPLSMSERVVLESELDTSLAYTGQNLGGLAAFGFAAIFVGATVVFATRSRRRRYGRRPGQ